MSSLSLPAVATLSDKYYIREMEIRDENRRSIKVFWQENDIR